MKTNFVVFVSSNQADEYAGTQFDSTDANPYDSCGLVAGLRPARQ
jgi:hypothetical protein